MKVLKVFVPQLVSAIVFLSLSLLGAQQSRAQSTFSYPPFPSSAAAGLQTNSYAGNALITTNGVLQLTSSGENQVGSAWYINLPNSQTNPPGTVSLLTGFTSTFTLQFTGQGGQLYNGQAGADGIAFVIQNGTFGNYNGDVTGGSSALGPNDGRGGEIGFVGLTNSVAIQFDTWCNTEYGDTCASASSPTSADQVTIESCGTAANTANHNAGCSFGTQDLSALANPIYIGDGNQHTVSISYAPPASPSGTCGIGSTAGSAGCGALVVVIDGQSILSVPFNLNYLGLDPNDDAFVGFTGATGEAYEAQDVNSWSFAVVVTQPITVNPTGAGPTLTATFSTPATGGTVTAVTDYSTAGNGMSLPTGITTPVLTTINNIVPNSDWAQYVVGTPWATSSCTVKSGNGGSGNLCSQYINQCFDAITGSAATASDAYCPSALDAGFANYITLEDTFDWGLGGKQVIAPGTTASLIAFSVPSSNSSLQWNPSTTSTNNVCSQVPGTPSGQPCYLSDSLVDMYGDQTTTRGSKPKSKAWLVSVYNVPMLFTYIFAEPNPGTACPLKTAVQLNTAATVWVNGACLFDFKVNPAVASGGSTNNFQAAPPASLLYGPGSPAVAPGAIPTGDTLVSNPNAVCSGTGGNCAPAAWDTQTGSNAVAVITGTIPVTNPPLSSLGNNGTFTLHWSAIDTVGITEKSITLSPSVGGLCTLPDGSTVSGSQCYYTNYFTTQVNIDSTAPVITGYSFSPAGSPAGTFALNQTVYPTYTCTDNLSGLSTCGGVPVIGCPLSISSTSTTPISTSTPGAHSYSVTATDCASNTSASTTVSYTVASPADVAIIGGATSDTAKSITYVAAVLDLTQGTSAYGTVITFQITDPKSSVGGPITGVFADVSCSLFGCSELPSGPIACSTSGDTVTCNVGTLPSIFTLKGAVAQITIPVVAKPQSNATIGITATVSSDDDPNPKNNTTSVTVSVK
jgi:hypothetical protein